MGKGRKAEWKGDDLWRLLNLSLKQLQELYPDKSYNTLNASRAQWRDRIKRGEVQMPEKPSGSPEGMEFADVIKLHGMSPELAEQFQQQGFHVGFIKNNDGEIEYTIPLPSARGNRNDFINDFEPATAARITPSKRKPVERDHKLIYVFSDAQIAYRRLNSGELDPIHDEGVLEIGRTICRDLRPDLIVNLGDNVDLTELGRWDKDSDHFHRTLGPAFQRAHDYYAELRADNPDARIVEVDSNHNTRLKKFVLKFAPDLYGVRRAGAPDEEYPVLTYPFLANLGVVDVEWVSGYGAAEFVYGEEYDTPPIIFKHGESVSSNGSTAAAESKKHPDTHIVRGHGHRIESHHRTTRAGWYLGSYMVGAACKTTGEVPGYHNAIDDQNEVVKYQENWQTGVMVIRDYDGYYEFQHIPIIDGMAFYNGKVYQIEDEDTEQDS